LLTNGNLSEALLGNNAYSQVDTSETTQVVIESEPKTRRAEKLEKAKIDPERARFPYCIVWTPLPLISWFLPFIGHTGIAMSDGIIHDFAGPYYVSVDDLAFGETHK
jgi:hypothetical protein